MNLFAGPFNDEFGHELFSFQNYIRLLSKNYDKTIVCSNAARKFLYEDFAYDFIPLEQFTHKKDYPNYKFISRRDFPCHALEDRMIKNELFIKYGKPIAEKYDIVFHARRKISSSCENLSDKTYDDIYKLLKDKYSVAFIGTKDGAYCPKEALDLRDIELKNLANILSSSGLMVGQSSGPIHFSSLCGTPHLTWGGIKLYTFIRYAHLWNPFKTKCYLFEDLSTMDYLRRRAKSYKLPKNIFNSTHFSIVNTKENRLPSVELLYNTIENIFSKKI